MLAALIAPRSKKKKVRKTARFFERTNRQGNAKKTDLSPGSQSEAVISVAPRPPLFFLRTQSVRARFDRTIALKFSAGDAQPASDGELCRRGRKREVYLTMPLWWGVGG